MGDFGNMITSIVSIVEINVGKKIRSLYDKSVPVVKRIISDKNIDNEKAKIILDMLALSCFRRIAILPVVGAVSFVLRLSSFNVHALRIGSDRLDGDFVENYASAIMEFDAILERFGIDGQFLDLSDECFFVESAVKVIEKWGQK